MARQKAKEVRAYNRNQGADASCVYCKKPMRRDGDSVPRVHHDSIYGVVFFSGSLTPPETTIPGADYVGPIHLGRDGGESTCTRYKINEMRKRGLLEKVNS